MKETYTAGGVVLNAEGLVLVVNQRGNSWSLPKGHIDPGENAEMAARREIHEESGVSQLDLVKSLGSYQRYRIGEFGGEDKSELKNMEFFLFRTEEQDLQPTDPHNPEARWVPRDEVEGLLTHPKDKAFFAKVLPGLPER